MKFHRLVCVALMTLTLSLSLSLSPLCALAAPTAAPTALALDEPQEPSARDDDGSTPSEGARSALVGFNLLMGLGLYGPTLLFTLSNNSARVNVGTYMLTVGAAVGVPYLLTGAEDVSWGSFELSSGLALRGATHGLLMSGVFGVGSPRVASGLISGVSVLEAVAGYQYAKRARMSGGQAHTLVISSDLGTLAGLFLGGLALGDEISFRQYSSVLLAGSLVGFGAGELYRRSRGLTWGGAELVRLSALLGLFVTPALAESLSLDSVREVALTGLVTTAGGAFLGDWLARDRALSVGDALLIDVSAVGGAFFGAGVMYMINDNLSSSSAYLWSALLGASAGYALAYRAALKGDGEGAGGAEGDEGAEGGARASLGPWFTPLPQAGGRVEVARGVGLSGAF